MEKENQKNQKTQKTKTRVSKTLNLFRNFGLKAIPIMMVRNSLFEESELTLNFLVLIISSCLIATFGLVLNSAAVIIGAMIIAPLMLPLRGLSFATLEGDWELLRRSFVSIAVGTLLGISCSWLVGTVIGSPELGAQVLARTKPNLIDLLVAIVAGGISGFSKIRPSLEDAVPGTAIAVALMPPLCVVGLTLSQGEWTLSQGAFLLYITNLIGINLACMIVYIFSGYAQSTELSRSLNWGFSLVLIAVLVVPLGLTFWDVLEQGRVEEPVQELINSSLFNKEGVREVSDWNIDRRKNPPEITMAVRSIELITPEQVKEFEDAVNIKLGKRFKVKVDVTPFIPVESPNLQAN
ncbi:MULTISPECIES: TIGR00341 family protein [unclassified Moorena]|uniref:TIGR00341 family protein n=1 Tax=unclassified Moorena TaxID=2683338 RepID=UPI0013FF2B03|nr:MULTISPECIES: TIGR00341 family protein [unclassified Moorena]NEO16051.1 TIGR00341 family protein [Moorena sp. SIO3E8]NEP98238.1 TIGR00341 family protein [Moorena sp. SIO3F7]